LFGDLDHATGDHILYQIRIDSRPAQEFFDHSRVEVDRVHTIEGAAGTASAER
jgi:hypothetical protein